MSQIIQKLDQQQLKSLCGIVAHTSEGLTKSELTTLLGQCGICAVDDGSSRNQLGYTICLLILNWKHQRTGMHSIQEESMIKDPSNGF